MINRFEVKCHTGSSRRIITGFTAQLSEKVLIQARLWRVETLWKIFSEAPTVLTREG